MKSTETSRSSGPETGDGGFQEDRDKTLFDQAIAGMLTKASVPLDEKQLSKLVPW
jgi:hypothetical protein